MTFSFPYSAGNFFPQKKYMSWRFCGYQLTSRVESCVNV